MKQRNRKTPLVFRLGLLFLCAILCTSYLIGGLYARYTTSVTGSSTARVAYVVATASGESISDSNLIDPAAKMPYEFKVAVSNEKDGKISEVTLGYTIFVDLPENFPPMDIAVSDAEKDVESSTATCLVFKSTKLLPAGASADNSGSTNEHIVSFTATNETIGTFRGLQISIRVKAEQID